MSKSRLARLRTCRACGHDLLTQHDPEDETCDAFSGDLEVGVCPCGRESLTVNGEKLTPLEWLRWERKRRKQAERLAAILSDLDRCAHGRHEGDVCSGPSGCNGPSRGNPIAVTFGRQIGYNISGKAIVVPPRMDLSDPKAWVAP